MEEPEVLTKCSSGRRISIDSAHSPEFEFWMVRNPSFPQPDLLSADELFSDGILLPLDLLQCPFSDDPHDSNLPSHKTEPESSGSSRPESKHGSGPEISAGESTSSKRWKHIFKLTDKKNLQNSKDESFREKEKEKEKKKKCGAVGGSNGVSAAELNINIWPFSRSRSAGNGKISPRKVNSAPCSRSNSAGDSKSRKSPSSPSRGGVYLGWNNPVFQVRRSGGSGGGSEGQRKVKSDQKVVDKVESEDDLKVTSAAVTGGSKTRVLKLNVPMCIGYRQHSVCRSDEISGIDVAAADGGDAVTAGEGEFK